MKNTLKLLFLRMPATFIWVFSLAPATSEAFPKQETAILAGGCFWCMQSTFDQVKGVIKTTVGDTGGLEKNPNYRAVAMGKTGHTEAIRVVFDSNIVKYKEILEIFWKNIDPTDGKGQFVDRGPQYRPGIFWVTEVQRTDAISSKKQLNDSRRFQKPVVVEILKAGHFYPAEPYHQSYYTKKPQHYERYRRGSGRDKSIRQFRDVPRSSQK